MKHKAASPLICSGMCKQQAAHAMALPLRASPVLDERSKPRDGLWRHASLRDPVERPIDPVLGEAEERGLDDLLHRKGLLQCRVEALPGEALSQHQAERREFLLEAADERQNAFVAAKRKRDVGLSNAPSRAFDADDAPGERELRNRRHRLPAALALDMPDPLQRRAPRQRAKDLWLTVVPGTGAKFPPVRER